MRTIGIPYHRETMDLHIDEKNLATVVSARTGEYQTDQTEAEMVTEALKHPIGSLRLSELAAGKQKIVLITSDHTRAMPSQLTLPLLLKEIRDGKPDADITILVATGLHRAPTKEEQYQKFGADIVDHEKIAINRADCEEEFERVCTLPSGAEFIVNKLALHCDLLIAEGFIEPHLFAGFSGGARAFCRHLQYDGRQSEPFLSGDCKQIRAPPVLDLNRSMRYVCTPRKRSIFSLF